MTTSAEGHEEGAQAPFPPAWEGDLWEGHHQSCGVRVKTGCTCGESERIAEQDKIEESRGIRAKMPVAFEWLHTVLHLPPDIHIVGVSEDPNTTPDLGNLLIHMEAFSDGTFPHPYVIPLMHEKWNVSTGRMDVIFEGWEAIE